VVGNRDSFYILGLGFDEKLVNGLVSVGMLCMYVQVNHILWYHNKLGIYNNFVLCDNIVMEKENKKLISCIFSAITLRPEEWKKAQEVLKPNVRLETERNALYETDFLFKFKSPLARNLLKSDFKVHDLKLFKSMGEFGLSPFELTDYFVFPTQDENVVGWSKDYAEAEDIKNVTFGDKKEFFEKYIYAGVVDNKCFEKNEVTSLPNGTIAKRELVKLDNRKSILEAIKNNPGMSVMDMHKNGIGGEYKGCFSSGVMTGLFDGIIKDEDYGTPGSDERFKFVTTPIEKAIDGVVERIDDRLCDFEFLIDEHKQADDFFKKVTIARFERAFINPRSNAVPRNWAAYLAQRK